VSSTTGSSTGLAGSSTGFREGFVLGWTGGGDFIAVLAAAGSGVLD